MPITSTGTFSTAKASSYLQQLCKHFAHKIEVRYDAETGEAALPPGPCRMTASADELRIEVSAGDDEGIALAREIIDSHLKRFAFREGFEAMSWS